jgi:hypothetical protein
MPAPRDLFYTKWKRRNLEQQFAFFVVVSTLFLRSGDRWLPEAVADAVFPWIIAIGLACIPFLVRVRWKRTTALGEQLRTRLEEKSGKSLQGAPHVGFTAGSKVVNYDGDDCWDIGFIRFGERFEYVGDRCSFSISRENLVRSRVERPWRAGFDPRLFVDYLDEGVERTFILQPRFGNSGSERHLGLEKLRRDIALRPRPAVLSKSAAGN